MVSTMLRVVPVISVNMPFPSLGPCGRNHIFMGLFHSRDRWLTSNAFAIAVPLLMCSLLPSPGPLSAEHSVFFFNTVLLGLGSSEMTHFTDTQLF